MGSKINKLSPADFLKLEPTRENKIKEAEYAVLKHEDSYHPNQIAKALHPEYQRLVIADVDVVSEDVKTFTFVADKENGTEKLAYFSAGQYLSIMVEIGSIKVNRPYSISSSPKNALDGFYQITVKRVKGSLASEYILDNWNKGTKVTVSAPQGNFTYERLRDAKTVVAIAGGSGITPFRSLANAIVDGDEDCSLILLYGSRTKSDILFYDELKELESKTDKFKFVNVLSGEVCEGEESGFITADLIKKYAPEGEYSIFICGPQAMYVYLEEEIKKLSLRKKFVRQELFGELGNPAGESDYPQSAEGKTFNLKAIISGKEYEVKCKAEETMLNALESNGVLVPSNCKSGVCGWCHSRLVSGEVYVPKRGDGRRLADLKYGYVHPCVTFPLSDCVIDVPPFKN